jgi:hypothetical protein
VLSEAATLMSNTHVNKPGDVVRHDLLGPGEWIVMEAALAGAGKSYCHAYPDAWKLNLRKLRPDGSIDWSLPRIIRYQDTAAFPSNMVLPYLQPLRQDRLARRTDCSSEVDSGQNRSQRYHKRLGPL